MPFPSGHVLTADEYALVTDPPVAELRQTVAQTFATGSGTAVLFDTEDADTSNGHSTVSNTSRYTVQVAGRYQLSGGIGWVANATGMRYAYWVVNGTALSGASQILPGNASGTRYAAPTITVLLAVNDIVELFGLQSSGGNLNTEVTAGALGGQPRMSIRMVGGS